MALTSRQSRWPRTTSGPATSSRWSLAQRYDLDLDADFYDVYRVLLQINPSPYMYFLRHPEITIVGSSPEPMVQLLNGVGHLPAHRRDPAAGADG